MWLLDLGTAIIIFELHLGGRSIDPKRVILATFFALMPVFFRESEGHPTAPVLWGLEVVGA